MNEWMHTVLNVDDGSSHINIWYNNNKVMRHERNPHRDTALNCMQSSTILNVQFSIQFKYRCLLNNFFLVFLIKFFSLQAQRENEPDIKQHGCLRQTLRSNAVFHHLTKKFWNNTIVELQSIRFKTQNWHTCYIHLLICLCLWSKCK